MNQSRKSFKTGVSGPGAMMDVKAAAERLKVKVSTLYSWAYMRKIPHYKIGGLLRFGEADIDEWLSKQRVEVFEDRGLPR